LFSVFCYKSGHLGGIESVNRAGDHVFGRRVLVSNRVVTPEQAMDTSFDLKGVLA
jgi:3-phenylpropionate/trans-cinnamate dioxygenase ferredoxin reductase subunit